MSPLVHNFLLLVMCFLMGIAFVCMVRALRGPRFTDRVVAMNMIGTLVVLMVCILAYFLEEAFLIDVAILYALLNLLVVLVLCRVAVQRHTEEKAGRQEAHHD